jgi:choline-sulfatase
MNLSVPSKLVPRLLAWVALAGVGAIAATAPNRPNVLFIAIDDLRPEIAAYGAPEAVTPHLDALARKSLRFDRAYVTYPLCLPSRASMLTGRRIDYSGAGKQRSFPELIQLQQTWPKRLREAGYWTATSGKVYHGKVPQVDTAAWDVPGEDWHEGFKDWSPQLMKKVVAQGGDPDALKTFTSTGAGGSGALIWQAIDGDDEVLTDGQTASTVIGYLKSRPKDKPFLICAGFHRPHMPWLAPKKYFDLYPESAGRLSFMPANAKREILPEDRGSGVSSKADRWNEGMTDEESRKLVRGYLASVSYVDAQVGRLVAALREAGREEDTIVVVWGDHGYHLTDHGLWRKNTIYHVSNRIPFLIRVPGKSPGASSGLVESIDIYPTLLELTGVAAAGLRLDGRSLVPLLNQPDRTWTHPAFIHAGHYKGMVTERYRYSYAANRPEKLFDLQADPNEWNNLASDPAHAERIRTMRAATLAAWQGDVVTAPPTGAPPPAKKKKNSK